ncbi:MAG: hypothetical protein NTU79_00460 [Planctomycetota bacterium]|nr:hypothetical protein [Planctomycetota bacterium]
MFFIPISRWALAPVFQLLDMRREPGLLPFGYQFVSLEDIPMCLPALLVAPECQQTESKLIGDLALA